MLTLAAATPMKLGAQTYSYEDFTDPASGRTCALFARGITADTPVSWQLPTTHEAAVLLLALARLGAVG